MDWWVRKFLTIFSQDIRDSIFKDTKLELMKYLWLRGWPSKTSYKILMDLERKVEMPKMVSNKDFEITALL
jgi:hypothetical protein